MNNQTKKKFIIEPFCDYLKNQNLSENTILAYSATIKVFFELFSKISRTNIKDYRDFLLKNYKPKSVNLKLQGINKYLQFIHKEELQQKFIKIQQKSILENIISEEEYTLLKNKLKTDGRIKWYLIVWFLATTGIRVGELINIKIEDIKQNHLEIYSKGEKSRRIYIPEQLYAELKTWLESESRISGYLFKNRFGKQLTTRGIAIQIKSYAQEYGLDPKVVYPHSFRHFFAKQFLQKCPDITLLADLLGHENIATTRIYLRRTSAEQQQLINQTVTW